MLATYAKSVQQRGIIRGVRGEAWVQAPKDEDGENSYRALTFATLSLEELINALLRVCLS